MKTKLMDDNSLFGGCFPAGGFWKQMYLSSFKNETQPPSRMTHPVSQGTTAARPDRARSAVRRDASLRHGRMSWTRRRSRRTGLLRCSLALSGSNNFCPFCL